MEEILSPIRDFNSLKVAIASGCDAVYFGLDRFSARRKASFFNIDNVKSVVSYCHLFNVKAFLTLNVLIKESELEELKKILIRLEEIKFDAYIIQDLSILCLLKEINSKREIHASTQIGVSNLEGAKLIEKLGFSRVVLARETTLDDIKKIKNGTSLDIEYFIHGAVCISYSGSCLFSAIENGNDQSGNRGSCLQNCRMKFKNQNNEVGYFFSAKDQNLVDKVKELKENGVNSFKIEGRLKSNLYIASNIKMYKKALKGENYHDDLKLSYLAFNRGGFSKGYIYSDKKDLVFSKMQNNLGLKIGKIKKIIKENNKIYLLIYSNRVLNKGDGIKLSKNNKEIDGFLIQKIEQIGINLYKIPSMKIYSKDLDVSITSSKYEEEKVLIAKKIKIKIFLLGKENEKLSIKIESDRFSKKYESDYFLKKSEKKQNLTDIIKKIKKINETNFEVDEIIFSENYEELFIPSSVLNKLRRESLIDFENEIINNFENKIKNNNKINIDLDILQNETYKKIIVSDCLDLYKNIKKGEAFCFNIYSYDDIKKINSISQNNNVYIKLPVILTQNEINTIDKILDQNIGIYSENISHFSYSLRKKRRVIFGPLMNIYNTLFVSNIGLNNYLASLELTDKDSIRGGYLADSKIELMQFKHCPIIIMTGCNCSNCQYKHQISYHQNNNKYILERVKLNNCSFRLLKDEKISTKFNKSNYPEYVFKYFNKH